MLSEFYNHTLAFIISLALMASLIILSCVLNPTLIHLYFFFFLPVPGLESITGPLEEIALHDHTIGCIHIEFQLGVIVGKVLHREHICRKFAVIVGLTVNIYFLDAVGSNCFGDLYCF